MSMGMETEGMQGEMSPQTAGMQGDSMSPRNGQLYTQSNELRNSIIHYRRAADGTIEEVDRVATGGAGSGVFKPTSGQESAPNAFEGAASIILSPDRRFLFTTNGGDNSVSSFAVGDDGRLTLIDRRRDGQSRRGPQRHREVTRLLRPRRARSTCSTRSVPTTSASSRWTPKASSPVARSGTP